MIYPPVGPRSLPRPPEYPENTGNPSAPSNIKIITDISASIGVST